MATTRTFNAMLNEWLNYDLLKEEFVKRDYLIQKVDKDNNWKGGTLPVPFKGAHASSIMFGALTAASDISEDTYVRGEITSQPEVWGSLKFNHRDIMEHNGRVKEQSFLKLLPGVLDDFMTNMRDAISSHILSGHFTKLTSDGGVGGTAVVTHPQKFTIGQKVEIDDDNSAAVTGYVRTIALDTRTLTIYDARTGGAVIDLSGYATAQNAKILIEGGTASGMTSLRKSLLSAANGGEASLYGQTKTAYPYLQSINIDGSTVSSTNLHEKIFDAYTTIRQIGRGNADTVLMSYRNLGYLMKLVEHTSNVVTSTNVIGKGANNVRPGEMKASIYGWTEIKIYGVRGVLTVVGIQEMDDDVIMFIDWRALRFHSNNFFQKRTSPDGTQFYEVRETTGYSYIVDIGLFGDLVLHRPSYCGIMHSIP